VTSPKPDPKTDPTLVVERKLPFLPLARSVMTFCPPWDPFPVTIETIVLGDTGRDGENGPTREDLPELQQAGWIRHSLGPLEVCVRIIA
jgi:hypothetical protein